MGAETIRQPTAEGAKYAAGQGEAGCQQSGLCDRKAVFTLKILRHPDRQSGESRRIRPSNIGSISIRVDHAVQSAAASGTAVCSYRRRDQARKGARTPRPSPGARPHRCAGRICQPKSLISAGATNMLSAAPVVPAPKYAHGEAAPLIGERSVQRRACRPRTMRQPGRAPTPTGGTATGCVA